MKTNTFVTLALLFNLFVSPNHTYAKESPEQLFESALLKRYAPVFSHLAGRYSSIQCESILDIKRLGAENEFKNDFEVKVQLETFQGAHNPPHDIIIVTIQDIGNEFKIVNVERKQNVSLEEAKKACEKWKKKYNAHFTTQ